MYRRRLLASSIRPSLQSRNAIRTPFWQVHAAASSRTASENEPSPEEQAKEILRLKRRAQKVSKLPKKEYEELAAGAGFFVLATGILCFFAGMYLGLPEKAPSYAYKWELEAAIKDLRTSLGQDAISTDDEDLRKHGFSEWSPWNISQLPVAIAYPKTTAEVSQIAKCCTRYKIPMIPYSGGSSLEANYLAPHGGISIDMAHMNRIGNVREGDMDVTIQAGVRWTDLNEKIKHTGLFFPVDPGPTAMIGGMIGTGCSGTNTLRYGTMRDWVINLVVVLPDGEVVVTQRRPRKSAAGYSLNHLFVGSEGTLGVVTAATLKLAPIPQSTSVGVATFPTLRDAASAAAAVVRSGVPVEAIEIMDEVSMNVVNRAGSTHKAWQKVPTLFFKYSGHPEVAKIYETEVLSIASKHNLSSFESNIDSEEQKALWSARKESLRSMLSLREGEHAVWPTDVAVPISRLVDMLEEAKAELTDLGLFASVHGDFGNGKLHETILYDRSSMQERAKVEAHVRRMADKALRVQGTCSGEYGVGMSKKDDLYAELGRAPLNLMHKIKKAIDPLWIMNPGKIFDYDIPRKATEAEKYGKKIMAGWESWPTILPMRHANLARQDYLAFVIELAHQELLEVLRKEEAMGIGDPERRAFMRENTTALKEEELACQAELQDLENRVAELSRKRGKD